MRRLVPVRQAGAVGSVRSALMQSAPVATDYRQELLPHGAVVAKCSNMRLVTMLTPGLRMPRVVTHWCAASMTTPTPRGSSTSWMVSAICDSQGLLDLHPLGEHLDKARQLGTPDDAVCRHVTDMRLAQDGARPGLRHIRRRTPRRPARHVRAFPSVPPGRDRPRPTRSVCEPRPPPRRGAADAALPTRCAMGSRIGARRLHYPNPGLSSTSGHARMALSCETDCNVIVLLVCVAS